LAAGNGNSVSGFLPGHDQSDNKWVGG